MYITLHGRRHVCTVYVIILVHINNSFSGVEDEEAEEEEDEDDDMTVEEEGAEFEIVDEDEFERSQSLPPLNKIELSEASGGSIEK